MTTKKNWDDIVGNFENAFEEFDLNSGDYEAPLKVYLSQNNHQWFGPADDREGELKQGHQLEGYMNCPFRSLKKSSVWWQTQARVWETLRREVGAGGGAGRVVSLDMVGQRNQII